MKRRAPRLQLPRELLEHVAIRSGSRDGQHRIGMPPGNDRERAYRGGDVIDRLQVARHQQMRLGGSASAGRNASRLTMFGTTLVAMPYFENTASRNPDGTTTMPARASVGRTRRNWRAKNAPRPRPDS